MLLSPILTLDSSKVEDDLVFLMGCLREVLEESGEHSLAGQLPWLATPAPAVVDEAISPERLSQAYSIAFRLFSMVEQNAAVQQQRQTEAEHGLTAMQALWGQCLQQLVDRDLTAGSNCRGAAADARRAGPDRPPHRGQAHHRPRASPQPVSPAGEA